jgi:hypothetical protein
MYIFRALTGTGGGCLRRRPSPPLREEKREMLGAKEKKVAIATLGPGSPQGKLDAEVNSLYLNTDAAILFVKEREGKTGWRCLGHVIPDGIPSASGN